MFRDESKEVVRKAAGSKKAEQAPRTVSPKGKGKAGGVVVEPEINLDVFQRLGSRPVEVQPSQDVETTKYEAICYFMRSNAIPGSFWTSDLVSKFLLQSGGPASQRAMQASVVATATAMLSRVRGMPALKAVAHREYGSALRLLNTALADMEQAKTNQALGTVVLLAIYEVGSISCRLNITNWFRLLRQGLREILIVGRIISMVRLPCLISEALTSSRLMLV
jgi:hypothetical protein